MPDVQPGPSAFDIDYFAGGSSSSSTTVTTTTSSTTSGTMNAGSGYGVDIQGYIDSERRRSEEQIQSKIISNTKYKEVYDVLIKEGFKITKTTSITSIISFLRENVKEFDFA